MVQWINECPKFEISLELKKYVNNFLGKFQQFRNLTKIDIILIQFEASFRNTVKTHRDYFLYLNELLSLLNEQAFALYPKDYLKDAGLFLVILKVFDFMKVSLLHELYHRLFENARFKAIYMPGDYKKEGKDFNTYLEEFFVEYLAVDYNKNKLCNEKSKLQEYLDLNDITENKLCENTLKVYEIFKRYGNKSDNLKILLISLLFSYYILFSCWRVVKSFKPEFSEIFENIFNKILDLKEINFFKKEIILMKNIFIYEDLISIANKMRNLYNQL